MFVSKNHNINGHKTDYQLFIQTLNSQ